PAASKNVELCLSNIGNADGVSRARKTTLPIPAVLPKSPVTPWRRRTRLLRIVCNPEPAIGERFSLCRSYSRAIQNLPETVFTGINTAIHPAASPNPFHKCTYFITPHH